MYAVVSVVCVDILIPFVMTHAYDSDLDFDSNQDSTAYVNLIGPYKK